MKRFWNYAKPVLLTSTSLTTLAFAFIPESVFTQGFISVDYSPEWIIICNRLLTLLAVTILLGSVAFLYYICRRSVTICGNNYKIVVEYGDIFAKGDCNKVISFDECYSTKVGNNPDEIKAGSICGQFLMKFADVDFDNVVRNSGVKCSRRHSECHKQECYERGTIIPYEDYLLMAFAKLDANGCGFLSREEYLQCLDKMWKEIDIHYAMRSVAIPILGSGITRFNDETLSKQQLLDMIIASYRLSSHKMKHPAELHIVCKKDDQFSLNKIGQYV